MTPIRPAALAGWDSADEAARRAVLDHALARAQRDFEHAVLGQMASEFRRPTLEVVEASGPPLVVTIATSYRVYYYAQSGSDWSIQTVTIVESRLEDGAVVERVLHTDTVYLSEGESDDHDDEAAARRIIDAYLTMI